MHIFITKICKIIFFWAFLSSPNPSFNLWTLKLFVKSPKVGMRMPSSNLIKDKIKDQG
jgi:hypothetical protein